MRPLAFEERHLPVESESRACPFCPGNEEATLPALETYGPAGQWLVRDALDAYGRLDILVNNAGVLRDRMIFTMTAERFTTVTLAEPPTRVITDRLVAYDKMPITLS